MERETAWERSAWSHAHEMNPESVETRPVRHAEKSPSSAEQRGCPVECGRNGEGSVVQSVAILSYFLEAFFFLPFFLPWLVYELTSP